MRAVIVLLVLALFLLPRPVVAGDPGPLRAVESFLAAYWAMDEAAVVAQLCDADAERFDAQVFAALIRQIESPQFTADLSGLRYEIARRGEDWAQIRVAGEIRVQIEGVSAALTLAPKDVKLTTFWPVRVKDDAWKVCLRPPADLLRRLEPDQAAGVFLEAVFNGDYDTGQALICADQQGDLSEREFEQAFDAFINQDMTVDLSQVEYEIGEQTEDTATVRLGGTVAIMTPQRPYPFEIGAAQLGWGDITLIYEDGWKICQPFES